MMSIATIIPLIDIDHVLTVYFYPKEPKNWAKESWRTPKIE